MYGRLAVILLLFIILDGCRFDRPLKSTDGFIEINGSPVYYKTLGEGPPLIIVHGGPVLDHSYFLPHLEGLAKHYRLIFYDQRACGLSSVDVDSATMTPDGFVEDIEMLREGLGLEKVNLLGHSWGGLLAMKYGIKYSENLSALILSNSIAPSEADRRLESQKVAESVSPEDEKERKAIVRSGALSTTDPTAAIEKLLMLSFKPQMYDPQNLDLLKLYIPADYTTRSRLFGLLGPGLEAFDYYDELTAISCPTLVVYGETEPAVTLYADKMIRKIPRAELEVIRASGHFPFIEQQEFFTTTVVRFLQNR